MREVLKKNYTLLLVLLVVCPMTGAWRAFKIIFTRFDYEVNDKIVTVNVQIQNDTDSSLTVEFKTHEVINDVYLTASLALENDKGNYSTLLNHTLNFCKMLKVRNTDPLIRSIYDDLIRHGKLIRDCPIQKGTYTLTNYQVDEELMPSFLPETNFQFSVILSKPQNDVIFRGIIHGRIDKSKGFNNLKMFSLG
ncbi:uncharacterized protein [Drosophila tropicalis]|uniref:uncharacterized protein n=1 Tax=Drosophila tropicalis TaxID=46794 RepID=UPI0035AB83CD